MTDSLYMKFLAETPQEDLRTAVRILLENGLVNVSATSDNTFTLTLNAAGFDVYEDLREMGRFEELDDFLEARYATKN